MWALRKTANHLRVHGKYGNPLRVCTRKVENWNDNGMPSSAVDKVTECDNTKYAHNHGYIVARSFSYSSSFRSVHVSRGFGSQAGAQDKDEEHPVEDGFSELESPATDTNAATSNNNNNGGEVQVVPDTNAATSNNNNNGGEVQVVPDTEDEFSELETPDNASEYAHVDPYLSEAEGEKIDVQDSEALEKTGNATPLFRVVLDSKYHTLQNSLEKWVADGNVLTREEVIGSFVHLRRRRMFRRALTFSDWLEVKKPYVFNERDYAARLDLIAKINGIGKAQKYLESIPSDLRGQKVYQTLLANCSSANNIKKTEEVFNKMKDAGLPLSAFTYNQLLWLYKRHDKRKIASVLELMEKENVKPDIFTYKNLIDAKGRMGDIDGMEQVIENMKAEDVEPDNGTLAVLAKYYIAAGFTEKAEAVLKDMEKDSNRDKRNAMRLLLTLYADLGKLHEVERIWKVCESFPSIVLDEYVAMIVAWGKLGQIERAEATFENMVKSGKKLSAKHYNALLGVYADNKLLLKGKELLKRMSNNGCAIDPTTWDLLVRLYTESGEVEKADSILFKACSQRQLKPMYGSLMTILEKYAERADVANAEKIFERVRQAGYCSRIGPYEALLQAYANARVPAYGFKERMMADKVFPNRRISTLLQRVDAFKRDQLIDLLE